MPGLSDLWTGSSSAQALSIFSPLNILGSVCADSAVYGFPASGPRGRFPSASWRLWMSRPCSVGINPRPGRSGPLLRGHSGSGEHQTRGAVLCRAGCRVLLADPWRGCAAARPEPRWSGRVGCLGGSCAQPRLGGWPPTLRQDGPRGLLAAPRPRAAWSPAGRVQSCTRVPPACGSQGLCVSARGVLAELSGACKRISRALFSRGPQDGGFPGQWVLRMVASQDGGFPGQWFPGRWVLRTVASQDGGFSGRWVLRTVSCRAGNGRRLQHLKPPVSRPQRAGGGMAALCPAGGCAPAFKVWKGGWRLEGGLSSV